MFQFGFQTVAQAPVPVKLVAFGPKPAPQRFNSHAVSSHRPSLPGPHPPEPPRTPLAWLKTWLGRGLARYLSSEPPKVVLPAAMAELDAVAACLQPGDVILVEGNSRFSTGIKVLTQSTWSHAALYVGEEALFDHPAGRLPDGRRACIVEADLVEGVRAVSLDLYAGLPLRICRAVSLSEAERQKVVAHAVARLGHKYDLKHILDLMRWLLPLPSMPARFRPKLLTLGSGDPTRAICSMLVAEALQAVRYPILPQVQHMRRVDNPDVVDLTSEVMHLRHASLYVPRDFDLSPYFEIVKHSLARGFDHRQLVWSDQMMDADEALTVPAAEEASAFATAAGNGSAPERAAHAATANTAAAAAADEAIMAEPVNNPTTPLHKSGATLQRTATAARRPRYRDRDPLDAVDAQVRGEGATAGLDETSQPGGLGAQPAGRPKGWLARLTGR